MPALRPLCIPLLALSALAACATTGARQECRGPRPVDELARLSRVADSAGTAIRLSVDTLSSMPRRFLQGVVERVMMLEQCGGVRTADQLRDASATALAARTLGVPVVERAYVWARAAVIADSVDRQNWRAMALAWDQLQVLQRQPQWFGTVIACASPVLGRCSLAPLDSTRVTEALRIDFGLPTLKQQRLSVDSLNRVRGQP